MIKLQLPDLPVISGLVTERILEANLQERITLDHALGFAHACIEQGIGAVYVDNIGLPSSIVFVFTGLSFFKEKTCTIGLIYITKSKRSPRAAVECMKVAEEFARETKCDCIQGASWLWRGGDGTKKADLKKFWERFGFEEQEIHFYKKV